MNNWPSNQYLSGSENPGANPICISHHHMVFCQHLLSNLNTDKLYTTCNDCNYFLCICCPDYSKNVLCHYYLVIFTDSTCSANGSHSTTSGIGGPYSKQVEYQWSTPVDDCIDMNPAQANQCTELLAAIEGMCCLGNVLLSAEREWAKNGCKAEMAVAN